MALPALLGGVALGVAASKLLSKPGREYLKQEMKRDKLTADTLLVIQPKTFLQRAAANLTQSLFF